MGYSPLLQHQDMHSILHGVAGFAGCLSAPLLNARCCGQGAVLTLKLQREHVQEEVRPTGQCMY